MLKFTFYQEKPFILYANEKAYRYKQENFWFYTFLDQNQTKISLGEKSLQWMKFFEGIIQNSENFENLKQKLSFIDLVATKMPELVSQEIFNTEASQKLNFLLNQHKTGTNIIEFSDSNFFHKSTINLVSQMEKVNNEIENCELALNAAKHHINQVSICNFFTNRVHWKKALRMIERISINSVKKVFMEDLQNTIKYDLHNGLMEEAQQDDDEMELNLTVFQEKINFTGFNEYFNEKYSQFTSKIKSFDQKCLFNSTEEMKRFQKELEKQFNEFKEVYDCWLKQVCEEIEKSPLGYLQISQKLEKNENDYQSFIYSGEDHTSQKVYKFLISQLKGLKEIQKECRLSPEKINFSSNLIVSCIDFKKTVQKSSEKIMEELMSQIKMRINLDWEKIIEFVITMQPILVSQSVSENRNILLDPFALSQYKELEKTVVDFESIIDQIKVLEEVLGDNLDNFDLNHKKWNDFLAIFNQKREEVQEDTKNVCEHVEQKFAPALPQFLEIFNNFQSFICQNYQEISEKIGKNPEKLKSLAFEWEKFRDVNKSQFTTMKEFSHLFEERLLQIDKINTFLENGIGEWKYLLNSVKRFDEFIRKPWKESKYELEMFMLKLNKTSQFEFTEEAPKAFLKKETEKQQRYLHSLQKITGEDFNLKIWQKLFSHLRLHTKEETVTVFDFISSLEFLKSDKFFEELRNKARNEKTVIRLLDELSFFFRTIEFEFKNQTLAAKSFQIVVYFEKIQDLFNDKNSILCSLEGNPIAAEFQDRVHFLKNKVNTLEEAIANLKLLQAKWLSLYPIMTSEFIKKGRRIDHLKFITSSDSVFIILSKLAKNKFVETITEDADSLPRLISTLEMIQKNLFDFLELKRADFPRFYFLGDADLIEFLGSCHEEKAINNVIKKFLPASKSILLDENKKKIDGLSSDLGEKLVLQTPVDLSSNAQVWLNNLIHEIGYSLKAKFLKGYIDFPLALKTLPDTNEQICLLLSWVAFFKNLRSNLPLSDIKQILQNNMSFLTNSKPETAFAGNLKKSMLLQSIHQLEITSNLDTNNRPFDSFYFYSLLKYECSLTGDLSIDLGSYSTPYGFEYLGNSPRLVQTPLTDRCFLTMASAMVLGLGGNPYGPAGTGKTESIKALGNSLGRLVVVFNCDEAMEFRNMCRLFIGIVGAGAWGCFDEFNRLATKELSAISQVITQIQSKQRQKDETPVQIEKSQLKVPESAGIFITLNPVGGGYRGRNELPENLKVLFRSFAMTLPNSEHIVRISLICIGFEFKFACKVARFFVELFNSASRVLDGEKCYDWGLRGLKCLVSQVEVFLTSSEVKNKENKLKCIRAAIDANILAKLSCKDKKTFEIILQQSLKMLEDSAISLQVYKNSERMKLKEALAESAKELNLEVLSSQIDSCEKMATLLEQRVGFGVMGESSSGKSTLFTLLKNAYAKFEKKISVHRFVAKSMTKRDLFGNFTPTDNDYQEGIFVQVLRVALEDLANGSYHRTWIIFEGDVDPQWAESLNSALDDNQLYTLPTGERFLLPSSLKIVFETENLEYASMATISRIGLLNHQLNDEEKMSLAKSRFTKLEGSDFRTSFTECTNILDPLALLNSFPPSKLVLSISRKNINGLEFFCNKKTTIQDFMKFFSSHLSGRSQSNHWQNGQLVIQINDLDIIEKDEFGTRPMEQLLTQINDHGAVFHDGKLTKLKNIKFIINIYSKNSLKRLSSRLTNRLSYCDEYFQKEVQNKEKGINIGSMSKSVFRLPSTNVRRISLSTSFYESLHFKLKYPQIYQNSSFFKERFENLAAVFSDPNCRHILFACQTESKAEKITEIVAHEFDYESVYLSNAIDFAQQIFSVIDTLFEGKKVLLIANQTSGKNEQIMPLFDALCNYPSFSYFLEDYQLQTGSSDSEFMEKIKDVSNNFKIILLWNLKCENEFEELVSSYSSITRRFTSVIDPNISESILFDVLKLRFTKEYSEVVQLFGGTLERGEASIEGLLEQAEIFESIRSLKKEETKTKILQFEKGIATIQSTQHEVMKLQTKISEEKQKLTEEQILLDKQMDQIALATTQASEQKKLADSLQIQLTQEKENLSSKQESISTQLALVAPTVEEAKTQIRSLSKNNIDELRNYHFAPEIVLDIFGVLLRLMDEKDVSWNNMKKLLGKRTFIEQIVELDPKEINLNTLKDVESIIAKKSESFNREKVSRVSLAATPIAEFVKAIVKYVRAVHNIKPLEEESQKLKIDLQNSEKKLKETKENIRKLLGRQEELKSEMKEKTLQIQEARIQTEEEEKKLAKACALFSNLKQEHERWKEQHDKLLIYSGNMEKYCFAASEYLTWFSSCLPQTAQESFVKLKKQLQITDEFSLIEFLIPHQILNEWISKGHPNDEHNLLNSYRAMLFTPACVFYDPENRMAAFLKNFLSKADKISMSDSKLMFKLELSIKLGKSIILDSTEMPDHDLILQCLHRRVEENKMQLVHGNQRIDWNHNFKLILTYQEQFDPNLQISRMQNLNYSISKQTMQEEILALIINWKNPDLEKQKKESLAQRQICQQEIYMLEEKLLSLLGKAGGNLLEDHTLFATLDDVKTRSVAHCLNRQKLQETLANLEAQRHLFLDLANNLTSLFEIILGLSKITPRYASNNEFLNKRLRKFIENYKLEFESQSFLKNVTNVLCAENSLLLDEETKLVFLLSVVESQYLFKTSKNQDLFSCIFKPEAQIKEKSEKKLPALISDSFSKLWDLLQNEYPNISKEIESSKNKSEIENKLDKYPQIVKLALCRLMFPEQLEAHSRLFIQNHFSSEIFGAKICLKSIVSQNFAKTILVFENGVTGFLEKIEKQYENAVSILIGTVSVGQLTGKLTQLYNKPGILVLRSIHAHYQSFQAIIQFWTANEDKFHPDFRLVIGSAVSEGLPHHLIESSFKISLRKAATFSQNLENSKNLLMENGDSQLRKFQIFHSIVTERANFLPVGWTRDYQYSDFELKSILELYEILKSKKQISYVEETVLNAFYLAKVDHVGDQLVMKTIFKKVCDDNISHITNGEIKSEKVEEIIGLQYNALLAAKTKFMEGVVEKMRLLEGSALNQGVLSSHDKKHSILEKFNEFWSTFGQKLKGRLRKVRNNPLIEAYIESENTSLLQLIDLLEKISVSITQYLSGNIKMLDVLFCSELTRSETPLALREIKEGKLQLFDYLNSLLDLSSQLQENCSSLCEGSLQINLKGIIGYSKFFEVARLLHLQQKQDQFCKLRLVAVPKSEAFLTLSSLYIQGAILNSEVSIGRPLDENRFEIHQKVPQLCLAFKNKSLIEGKSYLVVDMFSNPQRTRKICEVFIEVQENDWEFLMLSSVSLYILN